jgi:hypothetical protein
MAVVTVAKRLSLCVYTLLHLDKKRVGHFPQLVVKKSAVSVSLVQYYTVFDTHYLGRRREVFLQVRTAVTLYL